MRPLTLRPLWASLGSIAILSSHPLCATPSTPAGFFPKPLSELTSEGFLVPQPHPQLRFPRDHGSHPGFKIEWWYLTGHLFGPKNERFGYQATFFRRAGSPPQNSANPSGSTRFRSDEIHLFHAAILDTRSRKFHHTERLARTGWDAASSPEQLHVRVGDASLTQTDPKLERFELQAQLPGEAKADSGFSLQLEPLKPLVLFGEDGVSRKGDSETAASWYLTFSRLKTHGELTLEGQQFAVSGETWMDHEISSSQLTETQAGWDWAGIQLQDGREIMTYRLRKKDGSTDPASALTWVDPSGKTRHFSANEFRWESRGQWTSPRSKANYPLPAALLCKDPETGEPLELLLQPLALDQELDGKLTGLAYWEGACEVFCKGRPIGSAYVELTGYAHDLSQRLR